MKLVPFIRQNLSRSIRKSQLQYNFFRNYVTRSEFDSPFDYVPKRTKPFIRWKTTGVFFVIGAFLAYNETLFDYYASFTDTQNVDELTPLRLEYELKHMPIYERLAHPRKNENWIKLESWENLDRNVLDNQNVITKTKKQKEYSKPSLPTKTLAQPGGICIRPVIFYNLDTGEGVTIVHAGYRLCGYPFIVHGGILATLLNETFKRNASLSNFTTSDLKDDFKVENLSISYKYPSFANQFLIIKTRRKESIGNDDNKTITLESVIESQKGQVCVKGEAVLHDTGRATNIMNQEQAKNKKWFLL